MNITITKDALDSVEHRCLVVLATKDGTVLNGTPAVSEQLQPFVESGEFGKNFGDSVYLTAPQGIKAERLLAFNLGEKVKKDNDYRRATARAWKGLRSKGFKGILFSLDGLPDEGAVRASVEGFILGDYNYSDCKSEKDKLPDHLESLTLHDTGDYGDKVTRWHNICMGTYRARDLNQMPPNLLYPESFANIVTSWSEECGYDVEVLVEEQLRALKMGSLLSVSQGSDREPRLIICDYTPENPSGKTICMVGKGVTFDSGGLSLKPGNAMPEMKGDMGGGATVAGVMSVLKAVNCPHRVVGLIPAVENMPSAKATRPSDVVTSMSGQTIEINNTDAEGRLIMADTFTYAKRYNPDFVVDFATLTGACLVALGPKICGVMGTHQGLIDMILESGNALHEPFWQLPLPDEYQELLKSATADTSNISSGKAGGAITAGLFLKRFAGEFNWAHCDIAAGIFDKPDDWNPSGGVGYGVRVMVDVLDKL